MKKILVIAAVFIGVTAFGQTGANQKISEKEATITSSNPGNTGVEMMIKELNLTSDQTIKVEDLFKRREAELSSAKAEAAMSKVSDINEKYEVEFRAILTPEQNAKLDAKQKDNNIQMERKPQKLKSTKAKTLKSN